MDSKKINIDEVIAEAMAEEEVKKDMKESKIPNNIFRSETKVSVDLNEYVTLKIMEKDFSSILSIICEGLELNYDKDGLRYNGDYNALAEAIKVIYPDIYSSIFAELKEEDK